MSVIVIEMNLNAGLLSKVGAVIFPVQIQPVTVKYRRSRTMISLRRVLSNGIIGDLALDKIRIEIAP